MCTLRIMKDLLDTLLAPLARLLVARGILFPDLAERLKMHYVEAAKSQTEGKITDSRLSVLTGLQRRDITRIRAVEHKESRPNHLARLIALWQTEPAYQADGRARDLPKNGAAPSFEALAREVRRDVHPRTMLDTLLATGTVTLVAETQTIRLAQTSYQPLAGSEDQLAYLTQNLGDHMDAATENVLGQNPPHFERAVHYTELTEAQIAELEAHHRKAQMAVFEEVSRKAAAFKKAGRGTHRFRAGGYFYRTKEENP